eukprot:TRINITY_DN10648_c0_g1_i2.p1 TRINITY_DN10648_c0_g1~~TRINITY_DN10648_c0_g1_i2.p1  ORF type:complete len:859 (-),score=118.69 TRINITY_DN10648_c0_g1_i2:211-2715(-)
MAEVDVNTLDEGMAKVALAALLQHQDQSVRAAANTAVQCASSKASKMSAAKEDTAPGDGIGRLFLEERQGPIVLVVGYYLITAHLALLLVDHLGFLRVSNYMAVTLVALASVCFIVCALVLANWTLTARLGQMLIDRVLNTRTNWKNDTLRSFCELGVWLSVNWSTFLATGGGAHGLVFALVCATTAGCLVAVAGELLTSSLRALENDVLETLSSRKKRATGTTGDSHEVSLASGSIVLVTIYGYGSIHAIYDRCSDILAACILVAAAGLGLLTVSKFIEAWEPTRRMGAKIQDRILNTAGNWQQHPMRSAAESSVWLASVMGTYNFREDILLALQMGALSGIVVCSFGEFLSERLTPCPNNKAGDIDHASGADRCKVTSARPDVALSDGTHRVTETRCFTWAEVSSHCSSEDAWLVIDGQVLDVSKWAPRHPGGSIIYKFVGADATDQFRAFHRPALESRLRPFCIGRVESDTSASAATVEYRALRERLWREGWFKPNLAYFAVKGCISVVLMLTSIAMILYLPPVNFWSQTIGAGMIMGIGWQQVGFMAHDSAHNGIVEPRGSDSFNWLAWLLAGPLFGISTRMWNEEHSMHHAITVRPREDPQFNYLPICLTSLKELDSPSMPVTNIEQLLMRVLVPVQHFTFLPLAMLIGRFNFYAISIGWSLKRVVTELTLRNRLGSLMDLAGMALYWAWYITLVSQLDGNLARTAFVLTSHWTVGILHVQLILSHLATETFTEEEERAEQFFAFQLKTTRNLDASWYDHWFHGGLEFQIEHHLFPQLPRHNLAKVKPFVEDICARHGIPYRSVSFYGALTEVLSDLRQLSYSLSNSIG